MAEQAWVVLKFGGTSVASKERWQTIAQVLQQRLREGFRPLLVCSAMAGVSNQLENLLVAAEQASYTQGLAEIEAVHTQLCLDLACSPALIADELATLARLLQGISLLQHRPAKVAAEVMALGELMLTRIAAAWLNKQPGLSCAWHDARSLLRSVSARGEHQSQAYLAASCLYEADSTVSKALAAQTAEHAVAITQGFIAGNQQGETVLLGRGGSDTSAAYFGAKLQAARVEIWTDVPGLFTANPREVPSARLLRHLTYEEAQELASSGAKVLHPRCIEPMRRSGIPIHIAWTERPDFAGTVISRQAQASVPTVKAVVVKTGVQLIAMDSMGMWQEVGFLADVFACFKKHGLSIDLVATSQSNVTVTLDAGANVVDAQRLRALATDLSTFCHARLMGACAVISLVGQRIRAMLAKMGTPFEAFAERQVFLISQAASDLNFSFAIAENEAAKVVERLHAVFFSEGDDQDASFGPSWAELAQASGDGTVDLPAVIPPPQAWWLAQRPTLLAMARERSPLYVYERSCLGAAVGRLKSLEAIKAIHYAVKANSNPDILRYLYAAGVQFDCVSWQEVLHVRREVPEVKPHDILFTPNFAPIGEYQEALAYGCHLTLDNIYPLAQHPQLFHGKPVLLRFDPERGQGHHRHVQTAGPQAKFGIALSELAEVKRLVVEHELQVIGLHAHVGSGIRTPETWAQTALFLAQLANEHFPTARVIDVGGGFGVPEKSGQRQLDLQAMAHHLAKFSAAYPQLALWIEPGRYLVAEAGVLLTRVTQLKQKGTRAFVGVDAGMNALIRPALYGAYHPIVNLERWEDEAVITADVVGPICETGDVLGAARPLPLTQEGDVLLIANAGAYGREMASFYNRRPPPAEVLIN